MSLRALGRAYHNNSQATSCDGGKCQLPMGVIVPHLHATSGNRIDGLRLMYHPGFPERENEGYYQYAYNPDITNNFVYHPANRVDSAPQETITSNVLVRNERPWEDVIISEVWIGGGRELSTLNEMFFVFYEYWNTSTAVGEHIGWCPFDLTSDRFLVDIISVQLGGVDYQYREIRCNMTQNRDNAYLDKQLTVQFKLAAPTKLPMGTVTLTGI